jgi:hypothetical protein
MAKNPPSIEKVPSVAEKVLKGKQPTPAETRELAAATLVTEGGNEETSSLAAKVVAGNHEPTPEERKSLAASVLIDKVRTLVADDKDLNKPEKTRIIKYLDAIQNITQQYEPEHDGPVLKVLVDKLKGFVGRLTKRVGEGVAVQQIFGLLTNLTELLPV